MSLWICLPDSIFEDLSHLREKTIRAGQIGRACAVVGVERIFLYKDPSGNFETDALLLKTLLDYLNTPQYLRRKMYPKKKELEFAGILPPLRTPLHTVVDTLNKIKEGDVRMGFVEEREKSLFADVGLESELVVENKASPGTYCLLRMTRKNGRLVCVPCQESDVNVYVGYLVKMVGSLPKHIRSIHQTSPVATSKKGRSVSAYWKEFSEQCRADRVELMFGGPERGLGGILDLQREGVLKGRVWNFFPSQKTETVRLEEAVIGCLTVTNIARNSSLPSSQP